ncbi:MAG: DUF6298 domain-containing protein [Bacteroidota bacterium]|nr:DUF6298 domain-containing protein [Bacteroidota bacterium]
MTVKNIYFRYYITILLLSFWGYHTALGVKDEKSRKVNILIDFSCAGYEGGVVLPQVGTEIFVKPSGGDDFKLLQSAIDYIGKLPLDSSGFRGTLQLSEGQFRISGNLNLDKSGIVIRGSNKEKKTILIATGINRRTLIEIKPKIPSKLSHLVSVTDSMVPAGSKILTVQNLDDFTVGDNIVINRPSTREWISDIGMDKKEGTFGDRRGLKWSVGSKNLVWDRVITSIDTVQKQITIDAPITTSLESIYGGGAVQKIIQDERINHVGIENLELKSDYDRNNKHDEEHSWIAIAINDATDCWVSGVTARHFVSSMVYVGHHGKRISILNCRSEEPVSEAAGFRRQSFWVEGQQVLVQNCTADSGMNDFAIGLCAGGPNVFLNCTASNALGASGASESWSSGTLYENVKIEGSGLRLTYDFERAQGGGWTAVNSVVWNCMAEDIAVSGPYCAPNIVVNADSSLYFNQLQKKLGLGTNLEKHRSPEIAQYDVLYKVREFKAADIPVDIEKAAPEIHPVEIVNGRFVKEGKVVWGGITGDPLWKGQTSPNAGVRSSITGFVPGKVGLGLTEDLNALIHNLIASGSSFYESFPGLWYDRRRDDHTIAKRENLNVWAPFYEMPWARSGQGQAWDGLSKYDLTKYNPWYFKRCRELANLCDENGLVVYFNFYNTHNLLEYLTHWVDFPWRPANNINNTGLAEPPKKEPWARMHMGNQFYDPTNSELRKLYHAYIFHLLDEVGNAKNVFFKLGTEYSGPLNFQRYFIETVHEWEILHNKNVRLILAAAKNVTDSILSDQELASQIDVIYTRYWQYRTEKASFSDDDELWAPTGGINRSFREMVGDAFILQNDIPFPTVEEKMYHQVREYRDRFPDKAIVSAYNDVSAIPSLMAGGAQVLKSYDKEARSGHITFDSFVNLYLSEILMLMNPNDHLLENQVENWCLSDSENKSMLIYSLNDSKITFSNDVSDKVFSGVWYDPLTERVFPLEGKLVVKKGMAIAKPTNYNMLLLLKQSD